MTSNYSSVLIAATVLLAVTVTVTAAGTTLSGTARAISGDEVVIHGARVRLFGIEAPAPGSECQGPAGRWPCGDRSQAALAALVDGKTLTCAVRHRVGHGHWQAVCQRNGADVGALQVEAGWARALSDVTTAYSTAEQTAKAGHKGIWRH